MSELVFAWLGCMCAAVGLVSAFAGAWRVGCVLETCSAMAWALVAMQMAWQRRRRRRREPYLVEHLKLGDRG